jgi:hypothetical protein
VYTGFGEKNIFDESTEDFRRTKKIHALCENREDKQENEMKKMMMMIAAVLMASVAVQADIIWRGDVNGIESTAGTTQSGWEAVKFAQLAGPRTGGVSSVTINDTLGSTTMIVRQWGTNTGVANNSGYVRGFTDIGSGLYDMYRDGFQFSGTNTNGRMYIAFDGLDNTKTYNVKLWSYDYSFGNSATQTFYNLTSGSEVSMGTLVLPNGNAGRPDDASDYMVSATGLSTDGAGRLTFSIYANGQNEKINGFELVQVVPEPATALLFGIGGMGAWMIRRKNLKSKEEADA